ncbi:MAG: PilZ domain-containing protein [Deltaproteobacteria bacterium]|nr:PilZ domain-containing protein [Deltaproteobacteria bacterium]MBW1920707.1 PilZ domain-containing protein [Deltaproteobacteria bacterium]MBW1934008.1 PilZ domain-containing protein [Deltaproteobacteria bacterium]MBW1976419.1 PilZ domain-containing protein [Deltaproteobacteria bacterium]MBW2043303.1 PilZ domain-containing protein [Deltaproteobacteria bacterium]
MGIIPRERRSHVRENFSLKLRFKVISPEEYEAIKASDDRGLGIEKKNLMLCPPEADNSDESTVHISSNLINFLVNMDEKLDRIVAMLSEDEKDKASLGQGTGEDISGSGMSIITEKSMEPGTIIAVNFVLSRFPMILINSHCEVVWTKPAGGDEGLFYKHGVKFLDLDPADREAIISWIFKKQRQSLRNAKRKEHGSTET